MRVAAHFIQSLIENMEITMFQLLGRRSMYKHVDSLTWNIKRILQLKKLHIESNLMHKDKTEYFDEAYFSWTRHNYKCAHNELTMLRDMYDSEFAAKQ